LLPLWPGHILCACNARWQTVALSVGAYLGAKNGGFEMKAIFGLFLALTVSVLLWSDVAGSQDKEVTIKGKVTCAKCGLMVAGQDKCATVVVEKKDAKDVIYYFDAESHKKFHGPVCTDTKDGSVKGVVSDKDGKKWIAAKDVTYDKK
jgi:Family of unknown function (DUF6370)